jgi:hypothetical protein
MSSYKVAYANTPKDIARAKSIADQYGSAKGEFYLVGLFQVKQKLWSEGKLDTFNQDHYDIVFDDIIAAQETA